MEKIKTNLEESNAPGALEKKAEEVIYDEIVAREAVGDKLIDYWTDSVIEQMPYEWFKISKKGNKVVIEPVEIKVIEG
jgi:hypothetical protein